MVTKESIPPSCEKDGSITHPEEYALTLEKRLIQKCQKDPELAVKPANKTTDPGKTNREGSEGYAVYMTFTMEGREK